MDSEQTRSLIDNQMKYMLGQISQVQFLNIIKKRIEKKKEELRK